MSWGILKYKLPEENDEFKTAQNGGIYSAIISDLDNFLRQKLKYESDKYTKSQLAVYSEIREELTSLLQQYNIEL